MVCVICDEHIIGVEPVFWIAKEKIIEHKARLSVSACQEYTMNSLEEELVLHYQLDDNDLKGLLLSRRAQKKEDTYTCCKSCKLSLRKGREKAPSQACNIQWIYSWRNTRHFDTQD